MEEAIDDDLENISEGRRNGSFLKHYIEQDAGIYVISDLVDLKAKNECSLKDEKEFSSMLTST